jgi:chemotaxis protein CheC
MSYVDYTPLQLDALREVGNIGAGNAATALSQLINEKINITVPSVNIIHINDIMNNVDGEQLTLGVIVRVLGDAPGNILFLFENDSAMVTIQNLTGLKEETISEMGSSVLCEITNIISSSYLTAISRLTNLVMITSVPAITLDMFSAILTTTFIESGQYEDYVIDIKTEMYNEKSYELPGHFYFIPMPGSLEKILNALGIF